MINHGNLKEMFDN